MNPNVGIGELLWDVFPDGRKVAGGAPFNFAFHCRQLGHGAVIVSRVGDDDLGRELRAEVKRLGLSDEFIQTDHDHPTGTVQVSVDASGHPTYTITEYVAWDFIEWDEATTGLAERTRGLCFGTLGSRSEAAADAISSFIKLARGGLAGCHRLFDMNIRQHYYSHSVLAYGIAHSPTLKISEEELPIVVGALGIPTGTREEMVRNLFAQNTAETRHIYITRGAEGSEYYYFRDLEPIRVPGVPVRVVDAVGAGDAFSAAMMCMWLENRWGIDALRFANHYAARVCEHQGGTPRIDRTEVERAAFGG